MRIEIVHIRDSDEGCDLVVFVDGVKVDPGAIEETNIDPGRGWTLDEWRESRDANADGASPAAAVAIREAFDVGEDSSYVEG